MRPVYRELKEEAARLNAASDGTKRYGVGIAQAGYNVTGGPNDHSEVALELNPDGSVTNYNTWEDQGQGADVGALVHTSEALKELNLTREQIHLVMADSQTCPLTGPAGANRSHYMAGNAIIDAGNKLLAAMRKTDGTLRTYDEMVAEGIPTKYMGVSDTTDITTGLNPDTGAGDPTPAYNYADFIALSEVDTVTGKTRVLKYKMFYDIGPIGSIHAVEGQGYGALIHSLGFALSDEYIDDAKHAHLPQLGFLYADDCPDDIELINLESIHATAPHGSVGCCEGFQAAGHVAIINSIYDAVRVRVWELPAKPAKVKALLEKKAAGESITQKTYALGDNMYEILEGYLANPIGGEANGSGM